MVIHLLARRDDRQGTVWVCRRNAVLPHYDREDPYRSTQDATQVTCEQCSKALRGPAMMVDGWLYQDDGGCWRVR